MKILKVIKTIFMHYLCNIKYFILDNEVLLICDELQNLHLEREMLQRGVFHKKCLPNQIENKCSKYKQTCAK